MLFIHKYKKIIVFLVLLSFIMVVFLGFNVMSQGMDGHISTNCLFSDMGVSFCPENIITMVFHHITAYQSFINIFLTNFNITTLISLLLFSFVVFAFSLYLLYLKYLIDIFRTINFPLYISHIKKTLHWLSIFENSPSLI